MSTFLETLLSSGAWAIEPAALEEMVRLVDLWASGQKPEASSIFGQSDSKKSLYDVRDGIAMIDVSGPLAKRAYMFQCGGTYAGISDAMHQAEMDSSVHSILMVIDSPGGTVNGLSSCAEVVSQVAQGKPVYAFADGNMCSAAYWLATCASEIGADQTSTVGSIGVRGMHTDRSGADAKNGVKRTHLTAGRYKAAGNDAAPLSEDDAAYLQDHLDTLYTIFVNHVSAQRGLDAAQADVWADGRVFIGDKARSAGLVDHITTLDAFVERIQAKRRQNMDLKQLQSEHPKLVEEITSTALAGQEGKIKEAVKAATDNVLALAENFMAAEDHSALKALAEMGANPEQAKALIGARAKPAAEQPKTDAAADAQAVAALAALQAAGANNVDPGKPGDPAKAETDALIAGMVSGMKGGN